MKKKCFVWLSIGIACCLVVAGIIISVFCFTNQSQSNAQFNVSFVEFDDNVLVDSEDVSALFYVNNSIPSTSYKGNGVEVVTAEEFKEFIQQYCNIISTDMPLIEAEVMDDTTTSTLIISCDRFSGTKRIYIQSIYRNVASKTLYIKTANGVSYVAESAPNTSAGSFLYLSISKDVLSSIENVTVFYPESHLSETIIPENTTNNTAKN